jgi:hypothetical protein
MLVSKYHQNSGPLNCSPNWKAILEFTPASQLHITYNVVMCYGYMNLCYGYMSHVFACIYEQGILCVTLILFGLPHRREGGFQEAAYLLRKLCTHGLPERRLVIPDESLTSGPYHLPGAVPVLLRDTAICRPINPRAPRASSTRG